MSAEVIKEFLVSLGYKVDGSSEKKFKEAVRGATLQAMLLAKAVEEAAEAAVKAVAKIATGFDQLYWSSQRTNAAAGNIRAFAFAVSQMGGSVDGARSSIEGIGRAIRTNPGFLSMIRSLGVATQSNGRLRDTVEIMGDLGKVLARKPYYVAAQYAQALGIDEQTLRAMMAGTGKWQAVYNERQKKLGLDPEKAAENANRFMQTFRNLQDTLETIFDKLAVDFSEPMLKAMQDLDAWLREHYDDIKRFVGEVAEATRKTAEAFRDLAVQLKPAWEGFDRIAKSLTGNDGLTAAFIALGAVLSLKVLAPLTRIAALIAGMATLPAWAMAALSLGTGTAGKWLDEKTGRPGGNEIFSNPKRMEEALKGKSSSNSGNGWFNENNAAGRWLNRNLPSWLGGNKAASKISANYPAGLAEGIKQAAADLGVDPEDLGTAISYETAGTFDPWKKGPTTKWGEHRGLIQWGEPQRAKYGVTEDMTPGQQMAAVAAYLKDAGVKPGMGLLDIYSAINAGEVGRYGASDAAAGGAPGTVADKVATMGAHRRKAAALLAKTENASSGGSFWSWVMNHVPNMAANAATFDKQMQGAALAPSPSSIANDSSRSVTIGDTNITVHGSGGDPEDLASAIGRVSQGSQAALLRNVQGAVR